MYQANGPLSSNSGGVSDEEDEEEGALVNGPWQTMLKQLIRSAFRGGKKKVQIQKENTPVQPSTSGVKKKPPPPMIPIVVSQLSEETSGRRKGRGKRKNEAERLKPMMVGWEERAVSKKLRKNLQHDYDKDPYAQEKKRPIRRQRGSGFDIQELLTKTGIELHWPCYQYMGPWTKLKKRLARGYSGINRLDKIAKQHDIDYSHTKNLQDKWKADSKMIKAITKLPGNKTLT